MMTSVNKILKIIDQIAPFETADSWDNVGLLVGNENQVVNRILIALDLTEEVLNEAIEEGFDLIVTHHPIIFSPLRKITTADRIGKILIETIQNEIAVIAAHTNLDKVFSNGINRYLADSLELEHLQILMPEGENLGYGYGHGIVGNLGSVLSFEEFISKVKKVFQIDHLKVSNSSDDKKVRKIVISSGASSDFITQAIITQADVFITSDLKYHECQNVIGTNLTLVDVGHYESESVYLDHFKAIIDDRISDKNYDVFTKVSETEHPIIKHL
ncbi:MAG: Nif3-like dinuclear metal center hexameric protein [Clostridiales bacterium]|nr:Nif3-like dinuclear metal center hexameric protein [Clostridiales bacterium]